MEKPTLILVCGGGNGAHTLAAMAASLTNVEVNVLTLFSDEAKRWSDALGDSSIVLDVVNNDGTHREIKGKPRLITNEPAAAMKGVDAVYFVVPAFAHQQYFDAISKFIEPDTIIIGMPGQSGFEFQAMKSLGDKVNVCAIISMETLPWACRIVEFGRKVQVLGIKDVLGVSVIPGNGNYKYPPLEYAQKIMGPKPELKSTQNYLVVTLLAMAIHPQIMYGKWRNWDGKPLTEVPLFYQGVDDIQADLLTKISDEVMALAKEINHQRKDLDMSEVMDIHDWYKIYYREQILDNSSLKSCMNTNKAYNGLVHPMKQENGGYVPDFTHRYISEDIPFGLVVLKGIAECVGLQTPTIDEVIAWGQQKLGKEFIVGSKLIGKDLGQTRAPQAYGFNKLADLCNML